MTFSLVVEKADCKACRRVIAEGEIRDDSDEALRAFAKSHDLYPEEVVVLRSPGGSLVGGMKLGRAFRELELSTHVGSFPGEDQTVRDDAGARNCASACAYAFLGGVTRSLADDGRIGLHRFFVSQDTSVSARAVVEATQDIVTELVGYVADMGVSKEFAVIATATASNDMNWLDYDRLLALGAVNGRDPQWQAKWQVLGTSKAIFVRSIRDDGSVDNYWADCSIVNVTRRPGDRLLYLNYFYTPGPTVTAKEPATAPSATGRARVVGGRSATGQYKQNASQSGPVLFEKADLPQHGPFAQTLGFHFSISEVMALAAEADSAYFVTRTGRELPGFPLANLAEVISSRLGQCD